MFTEGQIALVQESFAAAAPDPEEFAGELYARLFNADHDVGELFSAKASSQNRKFGAMISAIASGLDMFEAFRTPLKRLGSEHHRYGVEPEHYAALTRAFIATLERRLGDAWTYEHVRAWRAVLSEVIALMRDGAAIAHERRFAAA